jgi:hypothetical protein
LTVCHALLGSSKSRRIGSSLCHPFFVKHISHVQRECHETEHDQSKEKSHEYCRLSAIIA